MSAVDPVRQRRAQIGRLAEAGKRVGYAGIAAACAGLIVAIATSLAQWAIDLTIAGLIVTIVALPPAIIVSYGVAKAEREDPQPPG